MQTFALVSALLAAAAILLLQAPESANAVCCHSLQGVISTFVDEWNVQGPGGVGGGVKVRKAMCGDCTDPTPFCAYGKCDIIGCKCDGGCRSGSCGRKKRSVDGEEHSPKWVVAAGDRDGDGALSYFEAHELIKRSAGSATMEEVMGLDANNDGKITHDELD